MEIYKSIGILQSILKNVIVLEFIDDELIARFDSKIKLIFNFKTNLGTIYYRAIDYRYTKTKLVDSNTIQNTLFYVLNSEGIFNV